MLPSMKNQSDFAAKLYGYDGNVCSKSGDVKLKGR